MGHIVSRDFEIHIRVVFHVIRIRSFWQRQSAQLQTVTDTQLRYRNTVFSCHIGNRAVFEQLARKNKEQPRKETINRKSEKKKRAGKKETEKKKKNLERVKRIDKYFVNYLTQK